jgi:hypothetical protein
MLIVYRSAILGLHLSEAAVHEQFRPRDVAALVRPVKSA